tara:strand:- start:5 stop:259 length:255 start_codon:yes stop_codon:yes gene_type:complete
MHQLAIEQLFQRYLKAFHQQNMVDIRKCYQLPCTLHTPDQVVLIDNESIFEREFLDIFTVLSHAKITRFVAFAYSHASRSPNTI